MARLSTWTMIALFPLAAFATGCGDDDSGCPTECAPLGDIRCFGTQIQSCSARGECDVWTLVEDCAATNHICMNQGDGPFCGTLCTNPCQLGQERCLLDVAQACTENLDGCLFWDDLADCTDTGLICDDSTGDASCVTP